MTHRRTQRALCLLLIAALVLPLFTGCSKLTGGKGEKGIISPETARVGSDTLALDMGDFPMDGEATCEIKPVDAPALDGIEIDAYEFSLDTDEAPLSVMELTLPYDEKALGGLDPNGNVGAAYFNEETQEWEPVSFTVNDNGTVTIYTEHLSTYGCFVTTNDNTRKAYVSYVTPENAVYAGYSTDPDNVIIDTANNGGNPGELASITGWEVVEGLFEIGSAGIDATSHTLNSLSGFMLTAPKNSLLNNISERVGQLGLAISAAQVAVGMYDIYNGKTDAIGPCYREALKGSTAYVGGKAAGKLFGLAFLGVQAIDYSLTKFGEEAWKGRTDIYRTAYSLYYEGHEGKRTVRQWADIFLKARETARSPEAYALRIEGLVNRYVNQFWADETIVADYQSQAMKHGFTGGGGLKESVKEQISQEYANKLYRDDIQKAFKLIAERDVRIANRDVLKELKAVGKELNKYCSLELYDGTLTGDKKQSDRTGMEAFVTLPASVQDAEEWHATLNSEGGGTIKFTLLAYLMAGAPTELRLLEKDASPSGEPVAVIPFAMESANQRVDIGGDALPLAEILGSYDGELSINSVTISEETYQAYLAEMSDSDDAPGSRAECDAALNSMLQENPLSIDSLSISSDAPESGQCVIKVTVSNSDGDAYPGTVSARYENGFLITAGEKGESRIAVTKAADGTISIAGNDVALGVQDDETGAIALYVMANIDVVKVG